MRTIKIDIDSRKNGVHFSLTGARLFKGAGFDLTYSFDTALSVRGALSMAIGLLGPIIARKVPGEVEVVLPEPMAESDMEAWRSYHKLPTRIHIATRSDVPNPRPTPQSQNGNGPIGLLYGGGKDSAAALTLAEALYPTHPRHILRLNWNATSPERHRDAFERYVLPRLRPHTKFDYYWVTSTMHAELIDRTDAAAVHLARYLCSFIPYLEVQRPRFLCHGYDALEFHGSTYRRAHPQVLRHVDRVYAALRLPTTLRSLCFSLPPSVTFGIVARLRPELVSAIYMCESLNSRWCYRCRKCFTYAILCLMYEVRPHGFDLDEMFASSNPYMRRILEELEKSSSVCVNERLAELLAYRAHFQAVSGWGSAVIRGAKRMPLTDAAIGMLVRIFSTVQGHATPHMNDIWLRAAAYEGGEDFERQIRTLSHAHGFTTSDFAPIPGNINGNKVRYLLSDIE